MKREKQVQRQEQYKMASPTLTKVKTMLRACVREKGNLDEFAEWAFAALKEAGTHPRAVFYFLHSDPGYRVRRYFYDHDFFQTDDRYFEQPTKENDFRVVKWVKCEECQEHKRYCYRRTRLVEYQVPSHFW